MGTNVSERGGGSNPDLAYDESVAAELGFERLLRTLVGDANDAIVATDDEGTVVVANPAVDDVLGYSPEELVGTSLADVFPDGDGSAAAFVRRLADADGDGERRARHGDGFDVTVAVAAREHDRDGTRLFVVTLRDALGESGRASATTSDTAVQLKFDLQGFWDGLDDDCDSNDWEIQLDRTVRTGEQSFVQYGTLSNVTPEAAKPFVEALPKVEDVRPIAEREDGHFVEVQYSHAPLISTLADYGGRLRAASFSERSFRFVVELPARNDVRSVVEAVQEEYPNAVLVSKRTTDPEMATYEELEAAFADRLTERQRAAIEAAYFAGYFEWPRGSTAEEVAASLDICSSTFTQHLRAAEEKLLATLLEDGSAD